MTHDRPAASSSHATPSHWVEAGSKPWPGTGDEGKSDSWKTSFPLPSSTGYRDGFSLCNPNRAQRANREAQSPPRGGWADRLEHAPSTRPAGPPPVEVISDFLFFKIVPATWRSRAPRQANVPNGQIPKAGPSRMRLDDRIWKRYSPDGSHRSVE